MKFTKIAAIILVSAGIALSATATRAANVGTYQQQDVLMGFRTTGSSGAGTDLLMDLGQISLFANAATTLNLGNINTDLTNNFGTWFGSTVRWGAAASDTGSDDVWATRVVGQPAWHSDFDQSTAFNNIASTGTAYTNSLVFGSDPRITKQQVSTTNSWGYYQPGGAGSSNISFAYFNPTIEGGTNQGLSLYYLAEGSTNVGQLLGTFNLSSTGDLTFTSSIAAVPETSTYVAGALAVVGALLLRLKRIRQQS